MDGDTLVVLGSVAVALIGVFGTIAVALINNTKGRIKAIQRQTENDHIDSPGKISNLRENIDHNHLKVMERLDTIVFSHIKLKESHDDLTSKVLINTNALKEMGMKNGNMGS